MTTPPSEDDSPIRLAPAGLAPARLAMALVARLPGWKVLGVTEAGGGRGVFSTVWRVAVTAPSGSPRSVVVKLPVDGPNGRAARDSGAYEREAWAYRVLLTEDAAPLHPRCHLVVTDDDRGASFVLQDLGSHRQIDQVDGLPESDAEAVLRSLAGLHRRFRGDRLDRLAIRGPAPAGFAIEALLAGLAALERRGDARWLPVFTAMVEHRAALVDAFGSAAEPTLCHGDPRADNVAFDADGNAVLFDWQQLAVQIGEADVAWLCGTSLTPETRRASEADLVRSYATERGIDVEACWRRYRLGYVLPGLAVLFLAQRQATDRRTETMIANSIERIGTAVEDLGVAEIRT